MINKNNLKILVGDDGQNLSPTLPEEIKNYLIQAAQKDGLIFGSIANIRRSYGNIKDTLRAIEQLTTGTNFFSNLKISSLAECSLLDNISKALL